MDDAASQATHRSRPDDDEVHDANQGGGQPRKRQRVRLSCLECRRRKLSCDRGYPCQRCIKSGTPDRCTYETKSGMVMNASSGVPPAFAQLDSRRHGSELAMSARDSDSSVTRDKDYDRVRRLELEVMHLKNQLNQHSNTASSFDGSTVAASNSPPAHKDEIPQSPTDPDADDLSPPCLGYDKSELRFFRGKEFRTRYYGPHNATMAFLEVTFFPLFSRSPPLFLSALAFTSDTFIGAGSFGR